MQSVAWRMIYNMRVKMKATSTHQIRKFKRRCVRRFLGQMMVTIAVILKDYTYLNNNVNFVCVFVLFLYYFY